MKRIAIVGIVLSFSLAGFPQERSASREPSVAGDKSFAASAASPTRLTFGDVQFAVPAGWKHAETKAGASQANVMLMAPPDITQEKNFSLLLTPGQDLHGANFSQALDAVLKKSLAPNERFLQYSPLSPRKDAAGFDLLARAMVIADDQGHHSVRVCFAANPHDRLEMLIASADSQETFKRYQPELASVLGSLSYDKAPASADGREHDNAAVRTPATIAPGAPAAQNQQQNDASRTAKAAPMGRRAQIREGESVLLCTDPARLDGAMDFAKYGDSYNALRALRNDAFFRVNGPASVAVKETELKSRWPKVLVTVLNGDLAGRTGWVVLSELKDLNDLKEPEK